MTDTQIHSQDRQAENQFESRIEARLSWAARRHEAASPASAVLDEMAASPEEQHLTALLRQFFTLPPTAEGNSRKRAIEAELAAFKERPDALARCMALMSSPGSDRYVLWFCCSTLEDTVETRWPRTDPATRLALRSGVLGFLVARRARPLPQRLGGGARGAPRRGGVRLRVTARRALGRRGRLRVRRASSQAPRDDSAGGARVSAVGGDLPGAGKAGDDRRAVAAKPSRGGLGSGVLYTATIVITKHSNGINSGR